ncbi:amine oxidase [Chryseobacterium sp. Leaf180]|nr:amine oxidase [Chryseobacterium sp. Leaf180]
MGGFECADQQNAFGNRVDLYEMTGHDHFLEEDYHRANDLGIFSVREGIRWSFVEKKPYEYDWSEVERMIFAAKKHSIQIIWDICHFGYPDDLTPFHPMFARRFTHLCVAFVKKYREISPDDELIITPINEVSFISWLGGDARGTSPYCIHQGWEVKYSLMRAYIEGVVAIKEIDANIKILATEPLINIVAENPLDSIAVLNAKKNHEDQFQVLDILCGKICPELGGKPELLDFIGVNFYYNNQWINETHEFLPWADEPPHTSYRNLESLAGEVFVRYGKPLLISETSHPGEDSAKWLNMINFECQKILKQGIPLLGCCIYPLIDRPDWDITDHWHHSGIWDIVNSETLERVVCEDSFAACKAIGEIDSVFSGQQDFSFHDSGHGNV